MQGSRHRTERNMRRVGLGEGAPQGKYVASGYSVHEEENEHLQEGLRVKVNWLKQVAIEIFEEVQIQNQQLLPKIDSDFDSTGESLGAIMARLKLLPRGSQTKVFCYMMTFIIFVFTILYWVIRLR